MSDVTLDLNQITECKTIKSTFVDGITVVLYHSIFTCLVLYLYRIL